MAEQPHARLYRGLPPVVRHTPRRLLLIGALFALTCSPAAVAAYEWYSVMGWYAIAKIGGAFIVGGVLGFAFGRGWWTLAVLYAAGFAILLGALPSSGFNYSAEHATGDTAAWFQWILGVSLGAGVRALMRRNGLLLRLVLVTPEPTRQAPVERVTPEHWRSGGLR